jgi:hypothetical protein
MLREGKRQMTLRHRWILFIRILLPLAILLLVPAQSMVNIAHAQSGAIEWSAPLNLSHTPQNSMIPAIVADGLGNVHVFWSEDVDGGPRQPGSPGSDSGSAIYYTRWNGQSWTTPVDVLYVPGENIANFVSVKVDNENRLHAVWTGQTNTYYSNALASQAESAHAWSPPQVVATNSAHSRWESDVVVDSAGSVHVVYATGDDAGVYHIRSNDGGATWSSPVQLSLPFDALETSFSHVRAIIDGTGRLHVVWQTNQIQGYGQGVYYARSLDNGDTWSRPVQLGYRGPSDTWIEWPYLADMGKSGLHLIYTNGSNKGRAYRVSNDRGETWSEARNVLPDLEGINGYNIPIVDGAGQMHLLINMRSRATQAAGLWYAEWTGNDWSPANPIYVGPNSAHYMAVAVSRGNEIHIVWNEIATGEIWYIRGTIQGLVPESVQIAPTPMPTAPTDPQMVPTITQSDLPLQTTVNGALPPTSSVADSPIIPGLIASAVIVGGAIVWRLQSITSASAAKRGR